MRAGEPGPFLIGQPRPRMPASTTHLVILPAYNPGPRLRETVAAVLRVWQPVLVVDDGSTDGSIDALPTLAQADSGLHVIRLAANSGTGAAILAGAEWARARGFTHGLAMDADGQHPAESIGAFMAAAQARPEALILGRPIFPTNTPAERRHGRKISIGLVRLELLGRAVDDPLFGFRVYPLAPLLDVLGARRGGRRYDFDTEAAVRLCWAGVPPCNLPAPVRYFSPAEGGVSHFRYGRDNLTLAWMHTRLIAELILRRWPALAAHRRRWQASRLSLAVATALALLPLRGAGPDPLVNAAHQVRPDDPAWTRLADAIAHQPDLASTFTESRSFSFKKDPVVLHGEVRVSPARGLSLHYTGPDERIVILDGQGVLVRAAQGQSAPPDDPRAGAVNEALLHILRFDFAALVKDFELYGESADGRWTLVLVPRSSPQRHAFARITVSGEGEVVRRIELRHSERQRIEIAIDPPRPTAPFTPDEVRAYFR